MTTTDQQQSDNLLLSAALVYAEFGIPVFPCKPNPPGPKQPLTPNGFKDATTDEKQIRAWWNRWPNAMIGVPTGLASGIDVLDLDLKPDEFIDGHKFMPRWEKLSKVICETPSGGHHLYFRSTGRVRNTTSQIAPGVDTRGEGGYVIVPPSSNAAGKYKFIAGNETYLENRNSILPPFPADLLAKLGARYTGWSGETPNADADRIACHGGHSQS